MTDEILCPNCDNEMDDIRADGRIYCDHCDDMYYLRELDLPANWVNPFEPKDDQS